MYEVELPLVNVLAAIERKGVALDIPYLEDFSKRLDKKIKVDAQTNFYIASSKVASSPVKDFVLDAIKKLKSIIKNREKQIIVEPLQVKYPQGAEKMMSTKHDIKNKLNRNIF